MVTCESLVIDGGIYIYGLCYLPDTHNHIHWGIFEVHAFIGSCLATKVFIGNLQAMEDLGHHKIGQ